MNAAGRGALSLAVLAAAGLQFAAQSQRLNEPIALPTGDVLAYALDARGRNMLFLADLTLDNVFELHGGATDFGTPPRRLSAPLVAGGDVKDFALTRDGSWAVYLADQAIDEAFELYSVPLDRHAPPARLHTALAADRDVVDFRLSSDGTRVVFLTNLRTAASFELWSAPIDASLPAVLLHTLGGGRDTLDFELAPDGTRVVERADPNGAAELFSVPIDGSAAPRVLNGTLVQFALVSEFRIAPDSSRVVYLSDQNRAGVFELYGVPLDGSAPARRLNPRLQITADIVSFELSADARHVVYKADQDTDTIDELFLTDFAGNHAVKLDPRLAPGGVVRDFGLSPDGRFVAFRAESSSAVDIELFCAPLRGGPWRDGHRPVSKVNGPLVSGGDVRLYAFAGERIVYLADQEVDNRLDVYSAPVAGGVTPLALGPQLAGTGASLLAVTDDGTTVVFRGERSNNVPELFAAPADGSGSWKHLNAPLTVGGAVLPDFELRGARVFFRADLETDGLFELFGSFVGRAFLPGR